MNSCCSPRLATVFIVASIMAGSTASALAQPYTYTRVPQPFNPISGRNSFSSHGLLGGLSRDGNTITGNGFEGRFGEYGDISNFDLPIAFQYRRDTGTFNYFPPVPGGWGPDTYAQHVSGDGSALVIQGGAQNDHFYVHGSGYTRPSPIYPLNITYVSNGGTLAVGDWGTPYGGFVYRNGAIVNPPPPAGYPGGLVYCNNGADAGNAFTTIEDYYYRFGSGWFRMLDVAPTGTVSAGVSALSADGNSVLGGYTDQSGAVRLFRWGPDTGFLTLTPPLTSSFGMISATSDLSMSLLSDGYWSADTGVVNLRSIINSSGILPSGISLNVFTGLADDRRTFLANFVDQSGFEHMGIITIPAPGASAIAALGLAAAARRRRR